MEGEGGLILSVSSSPPLRGLGLIYTSIILFIEGRRFPRGASCDDGGGTLLEFIVLELLLHWIVSGKRKEVSSSVNAGPNVFFCQSITLMDGKIHIITGSQA